MQEKLSKSLSNVIDSGPGERLCSIKIMFRSGLSEAASRSATQRVRDLVTEKESVDLRPRLGMMYCTTGVRTIEQIADDDDVIWLDLERTVSLEELLD